MKIVLIQIVALIAVIYEIGVLIYAAWVLYYFIKGERDERDYLHDPTCRGERLCDYDYALRDSIYQNPKERRKVQIDDHAH